MDEKLKKIGLTQYESKVYLALLKHGSMIGREVQERSGVPHGRAYEVLQSLISKGFVTSSRMKPKLFSPINPEIAITQFVNQQLTNLKDAEKEVKVGLAHIERLKAPLKARDKVTLIHTRDQLKEVHRQLYASTKKYQKNMFTYELVFSKERLNAMRRGIKFQMITTTLNKKNREFIIRDIAHGVKVKYYPFEEFRIKIVDGRLSLIKIVSKEDPNDWIAMLVESEGLTKGLEYFFDKIWKEAEEVV